MCVIVAQTSIVHCERIKNGDCVSKNLIQN